MRYNTLNESMIILFSTKKYIIKYDSLISTVLTTGHMSHIIFWLVETQIVTWSKEDYMNFDLGFWFLYHVGLLCMDRKFCQNGHYKGHNIHKKSVACVVKSIFHLPIQLSLAWTGHRPESSGLPAYVPYSSDHSTCYLSFLILYIASDGIVQLLLGSPLNSQAMLYLCQKH